MDHVEERAHREESALHVTDVAAGPTDQGVDTSVPCWHLHRWRRASQVKMMLVVFILAALVLFLTLGKREVRTHNSYFPV